MSEKAVEVLSSIDYHSYVPEFLPLSFQNALHDMINEFEIFKVLRLLIFIYFYIIVRKAYTNYAKRKQIERELALDKERKERELEELLNPKEPKVTETADQTWGWGKNTRRKVKKQEAILEASLKQMEMVDESAYNPDSDADIEDLLED